MNTVSRVHTIDSHLARRRDNFLLLRIIAALMVIYGHSFALARDTGGRDLFLQLGWPYYSGDIAVMMFFVISGFMVAGSFLGRASLADFVAARLLRIVPALALVLVACVLGGLALTRLDAGAYLASPETHRYVLQNLRFSSDMAWTLPGVFEGHRMQTVNGSLWTLPAEMRMYVLVAMLGVFGLLRNRRLGAVALLLLVLAGLLQPRLLPVHSDWLRLGAFFCAGILAQLYKDRIEIRHDVMLALAFLTYISYHTDGFRWLFGITLSYFCFWFAYRAPYVELGRLGDPSYGIYLWGWPLQQLLVALFPAITPMPNFLLAALGAIIMGLLSWRLVERPALSLKGRAGQWLERARPRAGAHANGVEPR